jgi:glycerol-3-phosphate dehydrogenase
LSEGEAQRLTRAYGTIAQQILGNARTRADLGRDFGHGLSEREVVHLIDNEWARTAEDLLWRRTKLGLRFSADEAAALDAWMAARLALHRST